MHELRTKGGPALVSRYPKVCWDNLRTNDMCHELADGISSSCMTVNFKCVLLHGFTINEVLTDASNRLDPVALR